MPVVTIAPADLVQTMRSFGRWWLDEVRGMVPADLRLPLMRQGPRAEIRPGRSSTAVHRIRAGVLEELLDPLPTAEFTPANWAEVAELTAGHRTSFVLAPPLVHMLRLKLPKAARGRLAAAVPLQLRDHSPLDPAATAWGISVVQSVEDGLDVRVVIAHRATLDALATGYRQASDIVPPIFAEQDDRRILLRPGERTAWRPSRETLPWLVAAALLAATPFVGWGVLAYEEGASEARVADLQEQAAPLLQSGRWLRRRAEAARSLRTLLAAPTATSTIDALAARLPEGATLTMLDAELGSGVSLEVVAADPDAVRRALLGTARLPGMRDVNEFKGPDGNVHLSFTTAGR